MKKGMILVLSVFFFFISSVCAASSCSYQEQSSINSIASQVKASYELKEGILDPSKYLVPAVVAGTEEESTYVAKYRYLQISILNITEETYVKVKSEDGYSKTIEYSDTYQGIYSLDWDDLTKITPLTIEVYSSNKTGCPNEKYRVLYLTLPKANEYASSSECVDNENFYLCKELITFQEPDFNTFEKKIAAYKEGKISNIGEELVGKTKGLTNAQILIISISASVLVVGVVIVITLKKKRRIKK